MFALFDFLFYLYILYILGIIGAFVVTTFSLICITVFVLTCVLALLAFRFCISYVTNRASWLQDFNKLTYLLTYSVAILT